MTKCVACMGKIRPKLTSNSVQIVSEPQRNKWGPSSPEARQPQGEWASALRGARTLGPRKAAATEAAPSTIAGHPTYLTGPATFKDHGGLSHSRAPVLQLHNRQLTQTKQAPRHTTGACAQIDVLQQLPDAAVWNDIDQGKGTSTDRLRTRVQCYSMCILGVFLFWVLFCCYNRQGAGKIWNEVYANC